MAKRVVATAPSHCPVADIDHLPISGTPAPHLSAFGDSILLPLGAFADVMDRVPSAFALTRGPEHFVAYANAAFHALMGDTQAIELRGKITDALPAHTAMPLLAVLDRAFRLGISLHGQRLEDVGGMIYPLVCSVWPAQTFAGETDGLLIEVRPSTQAESSLALQREIAERLLVSAMREQQSAEYAESASRSATFLAGESRRLGESLDETKTIGAITRTTLPEAGAWCIVDIVDPDASMHRLAVIHPDPTKQAILADLDGRWVPRGDDQFGLPVAFRGGATSASSVDLGPIFADDTNAPDIAASLRSLGAGPSLTVPMLVDERLIGALTFVSASQTHVYTPDDIQLAQELAARSGAALDRARRHGESIALRIHAESASRAKSAFLGMMSHELRTPLNAIGGYVDLIEMELHGPISEAQRTDLGRIRANQRYLTGLITDLLNLTRLDSGQTVYNTGDILVPEVIEASRLLVAPLIAQRELAYDNSAVEPDVVARGDWDKVVQILVNLLSNAIKFTRPGGTIRVGCSATETGVMIRVTDTGIGIPQEKLELIFDPFVQLESSTLSTESGVGLGLAISRGLARAMHGDLIAESTQGHGARMTLSLPRPTVRGSVEQGAARPTDAS